MRLAFLGTPEFAVPTLAALAEAGHEICAVYSQPPRPAGRGHREKPSPVSAFASRNDWPVRTPTSLKNRKEQEVFSALDLDAAVVVAYGLILPKGILESPRLGCFNVHASLLPRWRGAAPIQRAILAGDRETGISIMAMEEGLDSGPVYMRIPVPIGPETTARDLHDALSEAGARAMVDTLARIASDPDLKPEPQDASAATYADKLNKDEGRMDWRMSAGDLERRLRAFTPWPGVWFEVEGEKIKVLSAQVLPGDGRPGEVLDDRLTIACANGALRLLELQRAGKKAMPSDAFLRGFDVKQGAILPCPVTN
ncbi:MAG: methionyl-tRNA formyltransferase [Kiloniellales bacterium]|nr:methionyl-tRNA formyltransferase [Kiloniellales bacterium]